MTLEQALANSEYDTATMIDQNGYRVTVASESKRIRVSAGEDGGAARMQSDIHTMDEFQEHFAEFYSSDRWEALGEADA